MQVVSFLPSARMLERVVEMRKNRRKSGGVFAKMTKPGQDLRIDTILRLTMHDGFVFYVFLCTFVTK